MSASACDYRSIRDYAIIGDGHTAALVSVDGSVDWCCWPQFDSPAVFCRLLDATKGGWFRVGPAGRHSSLRSYSGLTNVLTTTYESDEGTFRVTDFMPIERHPARRKGRDLQPSGRILRRIEGLSGRSRVEVAFRPTMDYGRAPAQFELHPLGVVARANREVLSLSCPAQFHIDEGGVARAEIEIAQGERTSIALLYDAEAPAAERAAKRLEADLKTTLHFWEKWLGSCIYEGPYADAVHRSALALKLLIFSPTGALIAAPTTSLPEEIGGGRNWDYRFTWLRDSALTLHALETIGYYDEAINFFEWLESLNLHNRGKLQIMYTIDGDADLPERDLNHLDGYCGSRPVRIGNAASNHVQLDIYGEVLDAAYISFRRMGRHLRQETWAMLRELANQAANRWQEDDRGIWEWRGDPRPFLHSKVMCWTTLDRAIRLATTFHLAADLNFWERQAVEIRRAILERGFNPEIGAFTQAFGSSTLDSSALAIPRVGFLPADDPRVISTVDKVRDQLSDNGLLYRYLNDDGLPGREGAFTLCTFWLVDALAGQGRISRAREVFERVVRHANDVGLLSEEIDPSSGQLLGNYPQGFTHLGLIRSAANIGAAEAVSRGARARHGV